MPIVHLKGKVLPSAIQIAMMSLPPVQWDEMVLLRNIQSYISLTGCELRPGF
jgi:hypothetical protein